MVNEINHLFYIHTNKKQIEWQKEIVVNYYSAFVVICDSMWSVISLNQQTKITVVIGTNKILNYLTKKNIFFRLCQSKLIQRPMDFQ